MKFGTLDENKICFHFEKLEKCIMNIKDGMSTRGRGMLNTVGMSLF